MTTTLLRGDSQECLSLSQRGSRVGVMTTAPTFEINLPMTDEVGAEGCGMCGRSMRGKQRWQVRMVDGGGVLVPPDTPEDQIDPAGDLGFWYIGSECAKKIPARFKHKVEIDG